MRIALVMWTALALSARAAAAEDDWVTPVVAPDAIAVTVNEPASTFVVACADDKSSWLALYTIDKKAVAAEAVKVPIQVSKGIPEKAIRPLALDSHPTLPLVYVWLDLDRDQASSLSDAQRKAVVERLDHLLVYKIERGSAKLVSSGARGRTFINGRSIASLSVDAEHGRLFLPNAAVFHEDGRWTPALAYTTLDKSGQPTLDADGQTTLHLQTLSRLSERFGWPWGVAVANRDVVLIGAFRGIAHCNLSDPLHRYGEIILPRTEHTCVVTGHPDRPIVYASAPGTRAAFAMMHADGYPTMMPQEVRLPGARATSRPLLIVERKVLAVGMYGGVSLAPLNDEGWFDGEPRFVSFGRMNVTAMAYSRGLDRLLVPVRELP